MRPLLAAALLALIVSGAVQAVTVWRVATVSATPESVLRSLITAEHIRVCGAEDDFASNTQLIWAARYKAQDMGYRNRLSHAFVDGKHVWDFYDFAGISWRYGAGEILVVNNYPDDISPSKAFAGWMSSPGHRAIIRNCDYDRFGVGAFQTKCCGDYGNKWYAAEFTNVSRP